MLNYFFHLRPFKNLSLLSLLFFSLFVSTLTYSETNSKPHKKCLTIHLAAELHGLTNPSTKALPIFAQSQPQFTGPLLPNNKTTRPTLQSLIRPLSKSQADAFVTYTTPNFAFHYTLSGPHAVLRSPADINGATPQYIIKAGEYFEQAYNTYIGEWNMRKLSKSKSSYFANKNNQGKYGIDVVDVSRAYKVEGCDPNTYGITLESPVYTILLENDFQTSYRCPQTRPVTLSIELPNDSTINRNYNQEWEKALAITAAHELFHAIQFSYVPELKDYHIWWDASATANEEILFPESNDYWQYLPTYFSNTTINFFDRFPAINHYSRALLPLYIHQELGPSFHSKLWELLAQNKKLEQALAQTLGSLGTSFTQIIPGYSLNIAYTYPEESVPFKEMSPDRRLWPILKTTPLDKYNIVVKTGIAPPLSIQKFTLPRDTQTPSYKLSLNKGSQLYINTRNKNKLTGAFIEDAPASLSLPVYSEETTYVVISNPHPTDTSYFSFQPEKILYASEHIPYPNPLVLGKHYPTLYFTRIENNTDNQTLVIIDEWGQEVYNTSLRHQEISWNWDLKNKKGFQVLPGSYYIKIGNQAWKLLKISQTAPLK